MKLTKLAALGFVTFSMIGLGGQLAQAVEADSKGEVKLNYDWTNQGIVDPPTEGPGTVTPPEVKPPVGSQELAIVYWPSFDFGEAEYDEAKGNQLYAKPLTVKNDTTNKDVTMPQFVQIRSSVATWNLEVDATDFINQADSNDTLKGAQIIFTNVTAYKNTTATGTTAAKASSLGSVDSVVQKTSGKPTKIAGINISGAAARLGTLTGGESDYTSINSFTFGSEKTTTAASYKSILLEIPAGLKINEDNGNYVADLTWTLSEGI